MERGDRIIEVERSRGREGEGGRKERRGDRNVGREAEEDWGWIEGGRRYKYGEGKRGREGEGEGGGKGRREEGREMEDMDLVKGIHTLKSHLALHCKVWFSTRRKSPRCDTMGSCVNLCEQITM